MRHGIKKVKLTQGQDSHQAAMRKMCLNFLKHGRLDTTTKRAKLVKAKIDRLVHKAQKGTAADRNVLLRALAHTSVVNELINSIAPRYTRVSGFVSMHKLMMREGDNADMSRLTWVKADVEAPAVKAEKEAPAKEVTTKNKVATKKSPVKKTTTTISKKKA